MKKRKDRFIDKENLSQSMWEVSFFSKPLDIIESTADKNKIINKSTISVSPSSEFENKLAIGNDIESYELGNHYNKVLVNIEALGNMLLRDISNRMNQDTTSLSNDVKIMKDNLNDIFKDNNSYIRTTEFYLLKPHLYDKIIDNLKGLENYNIYNYYKDEIKEIQLFFQSGNGTTNSQQLEPENFPNQKEEKEKEKKESKKEGKGKGEKSDEDGDGDDGVEDKDGDDSDDRKTIKSRYSDKKPNNEIPGNPKPEDICNLNGREVFFRDPEAEVKKYSIRGSNYILSKRLANLLDISFETKPDTVHSLRMGKLDVNKIAEVPSGNFNIYKREEDDQDTRPFSVCILCDESGSMNGEKIRVQNNIVKILFHAFREVLPSDKIHVYGHTSSGKDTLIRIYNEPGLEKFDERIDSQFRTDHENNHDGIAIEQIYKRIRANTDESILFIGISDGQPAGYDYGGDSAVHDMKRVIEMAKRDNYVTVGIGIQSNSVLGIYQYATVINNLDQVPIKVSRILNDTVKREFKES